MCDSLVKYLNTTRHIHYYEAPIHSRKNQKHSCNRPRIHVISRINGIEVFDYLGRGSSVKAIIAASSILAIGTVIGSVYKHRYLSAGEQLGQDITKSDEGNHKRIKKAVLYTAMISWLLFEGADALLVAMASGSLLQMIALPLGKILKTAIFELPVVLNGGKQDVRYEKSHTIIRYIATAFRSLFPLMIAGTHALQVFQLTSMILKAASISIHMLSPVGIAIMLGGLITGLAGAYLTSHYDFQEAKSSTGAMGYLARGYKKLFGNRPWLTLALNTVGQGSLYAVGFLVGIKMLAGVSLLASGPIGWAATAAIVLLSFGFAYAISRKKMNGIGRYKDVESTGCADGIRTRSKSGSGLFDSGTDSPNTQERNNLMTPQNPLEPTAPPAHLKSC